MPDNRSVGMWTQAQANSIASLNLTSDQAENILLAMLFGEDGVVTEENSFVDEVRRPIRNNYNINEDFPESTELVSFVIMHFRDDFRGFRAALLILTPVTMFVVQRCGGEYF